MSIRPKDRLRILLSLLLILGVWAGVSAGLRLQRSRQRESDRLVRFEQQIKQSHLDEQARMESGEVWVGELHGAIDELPEAAVAIRNRSPASLVNQRRIGGTLLLHGSDLILESDLHECHPGSPLCTTGGSIQVRMGSHFVCAVSVGLLQISEDDSQASQFRVQWQPKADGTRLTLDEKLEIVRQLSEGSRPASPREFQRLMSRAYEFRSHGGADEEQRRENLRTIISTIFNSIESSQEV